MHVFRIPVGAKSTGKRKLPDTYPQINIKTLRDINHKFETSNFKTSLPDGTQPKTEQRSQASLAEHATLQRKNKKSKVKQTREQVLTCGAFSNENDSQTTLAYTHTHPSKIYEQFLNRCTAKDLIMMTNATPGSSLLPSFTLTCTR